MKHVIEESSRNHVLYYDSNGVHCSERECEINTDEKMSDASKKEIKQLAGTPDKLHEAKQ